MKIKMSYLLYILSIFPFLEMPRLGLLPAVNFVFLGWKAVVAVGILIVTTLYKKWNAASIMLALYCVVEMISTVLYNGDIVPVISDSLALMLPFLIVTFFSDELDIKELAVPIIILYLLYALITSLQLIQIPFHIFREHGLRDNYSSVLKDEYGPIFALGDPKRFVFILLPLMFLSSIIKTYVKSINYKVCIAVTFTLALFDIGYSWGVSALLAVGIFVILTFFYENKYLKKISDFLSIWKVYIIITIVNIVLLASSALDLFGAILGMFGKTTTLSGRTFIWLKAMPFIRESIVLGQGYDLGLIQNRFYGFVHLHNWVMNILYTGGISRLATFILLNVFVGIKLSHCQSSILKRATIAAVFCLLIIGLTDTPDYGMLFVFYAFGYNIEKYYEKKVDI